MLLHACCPAGPMHEQQQEHMLGQLYKWSMLKHSIMGILKMALADRMLKLCYAWIV